MSINGGRQVAVGVLLQNIPGTAYVRAGQLSQCPHQSYSQGAASTSALWSCCRALAKLNLAGFPETLIPHPHPQQEQVTGSS